MTFLFPKMARTSWKPLMARVLTTILCLNVTLGSFCEVLLTSWSFLAECECVPSSAAAKHVFGTIPPRRKTDRPYTSRRRPLHTGEPRTRRPVRALRALSAANIQDMLASPCCSAGCLAQFSERQVEDLRAPLQNLREDEIRAHFAAEVIFKRSNDLPIYLVAGVEVCRSAFLHLFGLSKHKWENVMEQANLGGTVP